MCSRGSGIRGGGMRSTECPSRLSQYSGVFSDLDLNTFIHELCMEQSDGVINMLPSLISSHSRILIFKKLKREEEDPKKLIFFFLIF